MSQKSSVMQLPQFVPKALTSDTDLKELTDGYERLSPVQYKEEPSVNTGYVIFKNEGNLHVLLLRKAKY